MAHYPGHLPTMYGDEGFENPAWLPEPFAYDDPAADFRRFASQEPYGGPAFFQRRAGLSDYNRRMQARYLLGAPEMGQGTQPSYYDFLVAGTGDPVNRPGYLGNTYDELRRRAEAAREAAIRAPGPYLAGEGEAAMTPEEFRRRAWLSSQFAGEDAASNQIAVANLLALQRNRGGAPVGDFGASAYTGRMGRAITDAMSTLYQQRLNVGQPKESFLDWYLKRTETA